MWEYETCGYLGNNNYHSLVKSEKEIGIQVQDSICSRKALQYKQINQCVIGKLQFSIDMRYLYRSKALEIMNIYYRILIHNV